MIKRDPIFLGCTRPQLFMGVPPLPFLVGGGGCLLLALYLHFGFLLLLPLVIVVMRRMTAKDDMIFRLLAMNLRMYLVARNRRLHEGCFSFAPAETRAPCARARR